MMLKIHAFAHRILDYSGHPYSYHLCCMKALEALGGQYFAYVHQDCQISPLPSNWTPWFPSTDQKSNFKKRVNNFVRQAAGPHRVFFIETFFRKEFKAFCKAIFLNAKSSDKVWILFRDDHILKHRKDRLAVKMWMWVLKKRFKNSLSLFTDSELIAEYLTSALKLPFQILPIPNVDCHIQPFAPSFSNNLLFLGEPRAEKGASLIKQLACSKDPMAASFNLTCSEALALPNGRLNIHFHDKVLSTEAYFQTLQKADIMLMPYDAHRYQRRSSGILIESIFMGKIPIVTAGSFLAYQLQKADLNELVVDFTRPDFFSHLHQLILRPELYEKLNRLQADFTKKHCQESFKEGFKIF
jgi:hypothetical protein